MYGILFTLLTIQQDLHCLQSILCSEDHTLPMDKIKIWLGYKSDWKFPEQSELNTGCPSKIAIFDFTNANFCSPQSSVGAKNCKYAVLIRQNVTAQHYFAPLKFAKICIKKMVCYTGNNFIVCVIYIAYCDEVLKMSFNIFV